MARRITCGKLCWTEREAKSIVLAAAYYRHQQHRQERHYYYCPGCKAWHTTSQ